MMKIPGIQLEDIHRHARGTELRLGCSRASDTYWHEGWLKRADMPARSLH